MCSLVFYKKFFGVELSFFLKVQTRGEFRPCHEESEDRGKLSPRLSMYYRERQV